MNERIFEELKLDPKYANCYLGVKARRVEGVQMATIIIEAYRADDVHAATVIERRSDMNPKNDYYFLGPMKPKGIRPLMKLKIPA